MTDGLRRLGRRRARAASLGLHHRPGSARVWCITGRSVRVLRRLSSVVLTLHFLDRISRAFVGLAEHEVALSQQLL